MQRTLLSVILIALTTAARGQWTTELHQLQPGWNAIYPLNDCTHFTIDQLLADHPEVTKLWRWVPSDLTSQFVASPLETLEGQEWRTWVRGEPENTTMTALQPNHGYLVYVNGASNISLQLTGRAILPKVDWRSSGANLLGFPARTTAAPNFGGTATGYFAPLAASGYSPATTQIYQYTGGEISTTNPSRVAAPTSSPIVRGKAYWVNLSIHSGFAAPLQVQLDSGADMDFGARGGPKKLLVKNTTGAPLTVTVSPTSSVTPPAGQTAIGGPVPLLRRIWNPAARAYSWQPVSAPLTAVLAAGASTEWTLAPDRAAMTGALGTHYATVLRVTDGLYSDITVPVSAVKSGLGGLWVGEAVIGQVQNHLQTFERDGSGATLVNEDPASPDFGKALLQNTENAKTATAQPFRLRLIVHVDENGAATLLSNVYYGVLDTLDAPLGFTLRQNALKPGFLSSATRITAVHLPLDVDAPLSGIFTANGTATATVVLGHQDAVNPFLHTYHPDHDNLDARFNALPLPAGIESPEVTRAITLSTDAGSPDGDPAWGASTLTGAYAETLAGLHKNPIEVEGRFTLRRLSEVTTLVR